MSPSTSSAGMSGSPAHTPTSPIATTACRNSYYFILQE